MQKETFKKQINILNHKKSDFKIILVCLFCFVTLFSCNKNQEKSILSLDIAKSQIDSFLNLKNNIIDSLLTNNKFEQSYDTLIALELNTKLDDASDSLQLQFYYFSAKIYLRKKLFSKALNSIDNARKLIPENYKGRNIYYSKIFSIKANINAHLTQFDQARIDIEKAIQYIPEGKDSENELVEIYVNAANIYAGTKEFDKAYYFYKYAENKLSDFDLGNYYHNMSVLYHRPLGQIDSAKIKLDKAIKIFDNIGLETIRNSFQSKSAKIAVQDKLLDSYELIAKYKNLFNEYDLEDNQLFISIISRNLAIEYKKLKNYKKAKSYYQKSLEIGLNVFPNQKNTNLARAFTGMASCEHLLGNPDKALHYYQKAIQSVCYHFDPKTDFDLPNFENDIIVDRHFLFEALCYKTFYLIQYYPKKDTIKDLNHYLNHLLHCDKLMTYNRKMLSKSSQFKEFSKLLNKHVRKYLIRINLLLFENLKDEKYLLDAYRYASKYKAIIFLDNKKKDKLISQEIHTENKRQKNEFLDQLLDAENNILTYVEKKNYSKDSLNILYNLKLQKLISFDSLLHEFKIRSPKYYNSNFENLDSFNFEDIYKPLDKNCAVIEYYFGTDSIYTFTFTNKNQLKYYSQKIPKSLSENILDFRSMIEQDTLTQLSTFLPKSNELYNILLKKPLADLKSKKITRLILIPDNDLHLLSFDALTTRKISDYTNLEWSSNLPFLLKDYAISIAYSNQLLFNQNIKSEFIASKYIGYGLEYNDTPLKKMSQEDSLEISKSSRKGFGRLLHSTIEIKESANLFNGTSFLNRNANISSFKKYAPKADILHIAAHGFVSNSLPLQSGLILSEENNQKGNILRASDIYALNINAHSVMLSACQTANGKINEGEGIRSLARAFYYAGCSNVTASLWSAPDFSTKEIVVPYFKFIKDGLPKDVALQKAKLNYLDNCEFNKDALPCNWSHLISTGNQEPIIFKKHWSFW